VNGDNDQYQDDEPKEVDPFSQGNILFAAFLIAIIAIVVADIWLTPAPHDIKVDQNAAIPWSPHPPAP